MDKEKQLEIAAAALETLKLLHNDFLASVSTLKESKVNGAELGVAEDELFAVCLGIHLKAAHRFIAREGVISCIEYSFQVEHDGKTLTILSIYLMQDQRLYLDSGRANTVCDASNRYLLSRLAPHLASALLASPMFAARA